MYSDKQYQYYDWNSIPIRVPVSGGDVEMYRDKKWGPPPSGRKSLGYYMKPGGEGSNIKNEAELKELMAKCDGGL